MQYVVFKGPKDDGGKQNDDGQLVGMPGPSSSK